VIYLIPVDNYESFQEISGVRDIGTIRLEGEYFTYKNILTLAAKAVNIMDFFLELAVLWCLLILGSSSRGRMVVSMDFDRHHFQHSLVLFPEHPACESLLGCCIIILRF
jgi:hypothetical protein